MAKKIVTTSLNLSKTSYNYNSGAIPGCKKALSNNIPDLIDELRYTNGQMGSVEITTAYTLNNETIATGWYNYIYIPHRIGGKDGAGGAGVGDNINYGNLLLTGMTLATRIYKIRLHNCSIGEMQVFARMSEIPTELSQLSEDSTHKVVKETDITNWNNKEDKSNKVTSIDSDSTDTQYPSAKCIYNIVGDIASTLDEIQGEVI